jgi:hypothetical protein
MNGDEPYFFLYHFDTHEISAHFERVLTAIIDALVVPAADLLFEDVMFYRAFRRFHDH